MEERELINRIKGLKKIQPDKNWLAFSRLEMQNKMGTEVAGERPRQNSLVSLLGFFSQPIMAGLSIVLFLAGGGFVVAKEAQNSLPGDKLYPVKIVLEKAEVKATTNEMARTKLEAEITGRRAQELTDISNLPTFQNEEKAQKVEQAMNQIQHQLTGAKNLKERMQNSENGNSPEAAEAVIAAKENNEKLKLAVEEIKKQISEIPENSSLSAKISDISEKLDKTHTEISEIIESIEELRGEVKKVQVENYETETPKVIPGD